MKFIWNYFSINLYNFDLDSKNKIVFIANDRKTSFEMSHILKVYIMTKIWMALKSCDYFYLKDTQHLTYNEYYYEDELYLFVHENFEIHKICTISYIWKKK